MKQTCASVRGFLLAVAVTSIFTLAATAQTESILYSFTGGNDGGGPFGGVIVDGKGNIYGTTEVGGANGAGAVFELTPNPNGTWTEQVLYSFVGFGSSDGNFPLSGLVFDAKGNLYGTTMGGGTNFQGTAFELSPGSNGTWTEQVIYNFTGGSSVAGSGQQSSLVVDGSGNLYGVYPFGCTYGFGCVYELVAGTNGTWTLKVLHAFSGGNDGSDPYGASLTFDSSGSLYGTTEEGGVHDYGVVFKLTPHTNGTWSEKVLHAFDGVDGVMGPIGKLTIDSHGNIYGTAEHAFELSPGPTGIYSEKSLHTFLGGRDGAFPESGLVLDTAGNLYGTTYSGGTHRGTVFELSPNSNGTWKENVLHRFSSTGGDGVFPTVTPLAIDGQGHLYGTSQGGSSNQGVVYEVTP